MFSEPLLSLAQEVLAAARAKRLKIATAESCTGGLIAGLLTEVAGSSDVFERGFVTYSNEAKEQLLGVPRDMLLKHGAVSRQVAQAMAEGALRHAAANFAVSVTGIAGPGGGSAEKPVGLVYVGVAGNPDCIGKDAAAGGALVSKFLFGDIGRGAVRLATMEQALKLLRSAM